MKIAIIFDNKVNMYALQRFEPLREKISFTVFEGERNSYDISMTKLNRHRLTHRGEISLALRSPLSTINKLIKNRFPRVDFYYHSLRRYLRGYYAVVCADVTRSAYTVSHLKEELGIKLFLMWFENIPYRGFFEERIQFMKKDIIPKVDHFLSCSDRARDVLILEGVPEEKMTTVYPGIDLERFRPCEYQEPLRKKYTIPEGAFVISYVGQLVSWKGVYNLLYAAKILKDRGINNLIFVVAGKGAQKGLMVKMIEEIGLREKFRFLDFLPYERVQDVYNLSDVFVLPSYPTMTWQEQFGMVLAEAMGCGKPVISTLSGSIPEVVDGCGIMIPPGDFYALADSLQRLMEDRPFREGLGKKARERAEGYFDMKKNAESLYKIFKSRV